jgi:hypothetical protein
MAIQWEDKSLRNCQQHARPKDTRPLSVIPHSQPYFHCSIYPFQNRLKNWFFQRIPYRYNSSTTNLNTHVVPFLKMANHFPSVLMHYSGGTYWSMENITTIYKQLRTQMSNFKKWRINIDILEFLFHIKDLSAKIKQEKNLPCSARFSTVNKTVFFSVPWMTNPLASNDLSITNTPLSLSDR